MIYNNENQEVKSVNDSNTDNLASNTDNSEKTLPNTRPWNIDEARAWLRTTREPRRLHLSFDEQCAVFAFAYDGVPNRYLAEAFHVSPTTISNITGCIESDPNPTRLVYEKGQNADLEMPRAVPHDHNARRNPNRKRRYWRVAEEFDILGQAKFAARYITPERYRMVQRARRADIIAKGRVPME